MLKKIIFDEKKGEREGGEREKEWVGGGLKVGWSEVEGRGSSR